MSVVAERSYFPLFLWSPQRLMAVVIETAEKQYSVPDFNIKPAKYEILLKRDSFVLIEYTVCYKTMCYIYGCSSFVLLGKRNQSVVVLNNWLVAV